MNGASLFGLCGAVLVGLALYGLIVDPKPLRKLLAFAVLGGGVFLIFGIVARRGAAAGLQADPIPQALVITGIVVSFAATALGIAIILRLAEETRQTALDDTRPETPNSDGT